MDVTPTRNLYSVASKSRGRLWHRPLGHRCGDRAYGSGAAASGVISVAILTQAVKMLIGQSRDVIEKD